MRVIYTNGFPPGTFHGINLFGVVFASRRWGPMRPDELRHEHIHTLQQRELLYLLFYLLYALEFALRLLRRPLHPLRAYRDLSFEREAYAHQHDASYPRRRRPYAWLRHWLPL